ncbi:MAG: GNAT family N-acetyltransferase [Lacibacter sp.]
MEVSFVPFNETFLAASWKWLQNEELRLLIDAAPVTKEQQLAWFKQLPNRSDYVIWGVSCENGPIGVCGLKHITAADAEYWGYIGEKEYRGKGIGTAILCFAEEQAVNMGLSGIYLHVLKSNEAAIRLYQKHAYQVAGETSKMLFMQKQVRTS